MENTLIEKVIKELEKNNISAIFINEPTEVLSVINTFIIPGMTIGVGDSETLVKLNVYKFLERSNVKYLNKCDSRLSRGDKRNIYIDNFSADLFIAGINALTTEGKIFNLDGNGSRVAPIIYGPEKVILICGTNKIVDSDQKAIARIKNIAAPMDAKRLNKRTPCVSAGKCMDCKSKDKICNYYTIIQGQFDKSRINVLIVNGEYGY